MISKKYLCSPPSESIKNNFPPFIKYCLRPSISFLLNISLGFAKIIRAAVFSLSTEISSLFVANCEKFRK